MHPYMANPVKRCEEDQSPSGGREGSLVGLLTGRSSGWALRPGLFTLLSCCSAAATRGQIHAGGNEA